MSDPLCLVLAHGRGLRMHSETGGASKGLLRLDEDTTILSNLLRSCESQGLDPVLTVRPGDSRLEEFATSRRSVHCSPAGYIVDVSRLSAGVDDVIVIDCDTVAEPTALTAALRGLLTSTSDCTLALAATPVSDDPRSIRPVVEEGRLSALTHDTSVPRTTGLYRFSGMTLHEIHLFVGQGGGTFHDFMELSAAKLRPVGLHVMERAFNVNWPADYHAARTWWNQVRPVAVRRTTAR